MYQLDQAIEIIEHGLLAVTHNSEYQVKKMDLHQRMKHYKMPGFGVAYVHNNKLAWAKGFGVVEAGSEKPVTTETIFQAASVSKPLTAMVVLHLVETGLLNLDADAIDFLRSWKIPQSKYTRERPEGTRPMVTLRGLLSHTAGINLCGYSGYPPGRTLPTFNNESNLVLSQEMTRQMAIQQKGIGGVGLNVIIKDGMTRFGHPGWNEGFHSIMIACLETGQWILWMANGENGRNLGWEVDRGLAEVVKWSW